MKNILHALPFRKITNDHLKKWNIALAIAFAVQAVMIVLFSAAHTLPVMVSFLTTDTLQSKLTHSSVIAPAIHQLFSVNLVYVVAVFLGIAAIAHAMLASVYRSRYEAGLKKRVNVVRWVEYALAGGLMVAVVGMVSGIYDFATLLMFLALAVVLSLYGLLAERTGFLSEHSTKWFGVSVGIVIGAIPWVVIGCYMVASGVFGSGVAIPAIAYWIYATVLLAFVGAGINMYLQSAKRGRWKDYAYGEWWYTCLSLVAKTLLAWELFVGILHP